MNRAVKSLVLLGCAFSLLASSCSAFLPRTKALAEPVTITFAVNNDNKDYYTKQIEAFKAIEPNISVQIKTAAGSAVDVQEISWEEMQFNTAEVLAQALDLSPFIQQEADFNRDDFYPGLLAAFSRDGKQLALPTAVNPYVLFYNRDLFDAQGLAYPTGALNWNDFKTLAMQLRDPETTTYGYLPMDDYTDAIFFAFQHGAGLLDQGIPQLDSPESIEALEWYATLFTAAGGAPNAERLSEDFGSRGLVNAVTQGKGALFISDFSTLRWYLGGQIKYSVGIAPLPQDQESYSVAQFQGLVISAKTAAPEAAWRWLRYLSRQPQPWTIPARRSVAESEAFAGEIGKENAEVARAVIQNARLISSFDPRLLLPVMEAYLGAVARTVDGMYPAAEALAEAQQKISP